MYRNSKKLQFWDEEIYPFDDLLPKNYGLTKSGKVMRWDNTYKVWLVCEHCRGENGIMVRIGAPNNLFGLQYSIASCFVPNPHNFGSVEYKDGDCYNCNADNLFWNDHSTNGTFREGVCDGYICFDGRQSHLEYIRGGKKILFIYPSDYEFMPELGKEYPICYSTRCLKKGIDLERLKYNRDNGVIKFTKSTEKYYKDVDNNEWKNNGVRIGETSDGSPCASVTRGRTFWGEDSLKNVTDNLMMSMFGRIPERVSILEFEYIENKQDEI